MTSIRRAWFLAIGFILVLACLPLFAEFKVPRLTGPVVDSADMFSARAEAELEQIISSAHAQGIAQLQVVTVPDMGGLEIEQASIEITDQWKLGDAKTDKGVLLLFAKDERKVRIEVGQGLEGDLTDVKSRRIISDYIIPRMKAGNPDEAALMGAAAILAVLDPNSVGQAGATRQAVPYQARDRRNPNVGKLLMFLFLFIFMILSSLGKRRGRGGILGAVAGGMLGGGLGRGGFGGGGFGGGGGWSGGGGGFSGGGSSGGW